MKRTLFLLVAFVVLPNFASAQECKGGFGEKFFKPASVALEYLATACGYTIVYPTAEDVPNQIVNLDGEEFSNADGAATAILSGVPYRHEINTTDRIITVRRMQPVTTLQTPPATTEAPAAVTYDPPPAPVVPMYAGYGRYPDPREGQIGGNMARRNLAYRNYDDYRSYGYGRNFGFYGAEYEQRLINRATWGALRFKKGREAFMENVEVYGCNQRLAQADEGNNVWDKKVFVPVNCRPLTFRYSDGRDDWEVEIDEMIVPLNIQDVKNITLDQGFFARARKRTKHLMYDMMEQPDGSFKRVPR